MSLPLTADGDMDDLPRTVRREKEARLREAREREARERGDTASGLSAPRPEPTGYGAAADPYTESYAAEPGYPAAVTSIDVPFFRLMLFFVKSVFAAIPALILLGMLLWFGGQALEAAFPELLKMKILITFPNS